MKRINKWKQENNVAYLKLQDDGVYTINAGNIYTSGNDVWFSTEATNEEEAIKIFDSFVNIWFNTPDMISDYMTKEDISIHDILNDNDIYLIDPSEKDYN